MSAIYKREEVLRAIYDMLYGICSEIYTSSRPVAKAPSSEFLVIRLSQGIRSESELHNSCIGQIIIYVKDRADNIENVVREEQLVQDISALFPFNNGFMVCNSTPYLSESRSDGMGYHSIIIQFRFIIKKL